MNVSTIRIVVSQLIWIVIPVLFGAIFGEMFAGASCDFDRSLCGAFSVRLLIVGFFLLIVSSAGLTLLLGELYKAARFESYVLSKRHRYAVFFSSLGGVMGAALTLLSIYLLFHSV